MNTWPPRNRNNLLFVRFQRSCALPKPSALRAHAPQSLQVPPKDLPKRFQDPTRCAWDLVRHPLEQFGPPKKPRGADGKMENAVEFGLLDEKLTDRQSQNANGARRELRGSSGISFSAVQLVTFTEKIAKKCMKTCDKCEEEPKKSK